MPTVMQVFYQFVKRALLFCVLYPALLHLINLLIHLNDFVASMPTITMICISMVIFELIRKNNRAGDVAALVFFSLGSLGIESPAFGEALLRERLDLFIIHLCIFSGIFLSVIDFINATYKKQIAKKQDKPKAASNKSVFTKVWFISFSALTLFSLMIGLWLPSRSDIPTSKIINTPTQKQDHSSNEIAVQIKSITFSPVSNS